VKSSELAKPVCNQYYTPSHAAVRKRISTRC